MMHRSLILATGLAVVALVACTTPFVSDGPANTPVARGQVLAATHCAACHAIATTGDSPNPIAPPLRTLAQIYPVDSLEEAFGEGIVVGHPAMPQFQFPPDHVRDLLAYLKSIQTG
jgi:cytochrome c